LRKTTDRSYYELRKLRTFEERFEYLKLRGSVGSSTFGFDRYMNQRFYASRQWKHIRDAAIARDEGLDLGMEGYEIFDKVIVHHMNPMTIEDLDKGRESVLDLDELVCTTHQTHNAIHYGDASLLRQPFVERRPGDTQLW